MKIGREFYCESFDGSFDWGKAKYIVVKLRVEYELPQRGGNDGLHQAIKVAIGSGSTTPFD